MTSSTNMAPITIGGHTCWNSLSRGTGSSYAMMLARKGLISDARRRELVSLFGGGVAAMPDDYFVGSRLGGPRPKPIELGRDPTASKRALGKVPQPAPQLYRIWGLFPLIQIVNSEALY